MNTLKVALMVCIVIAVVAFVSDVGYCAVVYSSINTPDGYLFNPYTNDGKNFFISDAHIFNNELVTPPGGTGPAGGIPTGWTVTVNGNTTNFAGGEININGGYIRFGYFKNPIGPNDWNLTRGGNVVAGTPEPATVASILFGALGIALKRRMFKKA